MSAPTPEPSPPAGTVPEPTTVDLTEFFCYECQSSISLAVAAAQPLCPFCRGNFLEPAPRPFPELDPTVGIGNLFIFEDFEDPVEFDDIDDIEIMNPVEARLYITRFIQDELGEIASPDAITAATTAAVSVLNHHIHDRVRPAPVASIDALPMVEVSEPDAECAICLEDLPLASAALMLPCSHQFHYRCIVSWLQMHNSCPMCRSYLPVPAADRVLPTLTFQLMTTASHRARDNDGAMFAEPPVSSSPTQLVQADTVEGGGGPANSGDTVSSGTVMSEARDGDDFFD